MTGLRLQILMLGTAMIHAGCTSNLIWQRSGFRATQDRTADGFELVLGTGMGDKGGEWGPVETVVSRIDGRTGKVLGQNRKWGQPEPQPDWVFGWKGEFVLFDADLLTFRRSTNVLVGRKATTPDLTLPGGMIWEGVGWRPPRIHLRLLYPNPLVGPLRSEEPFVVYSIDLDRMCAAEIAIPQPADEMDVFGDILVVKQANSLTAYSLQGARMWTVAGLDGEHLPSRYPPGLDDRVDSPLFITTRGSPIERNSAVIIRRALDGSVAWTKDIELASPDRASALGSYVIFIGKREYATVVQDQPSSRYERHWWVWDQAGNEIATGVEPSWKAEYAFRGGAAATRVGVAFDARRSTLVVGAGLDAALIRDSKVIKRLTGIPGEPLFLDDDVLVCRGETSHFAVRLDASP